VFALSAPGLARDRRLEMQHSRHSAGGCRLRAQGGRRAVWKHVGLRDGVEAVCLTFDLRHCSSRQLVSRCQRTRGGTSGCLSSDPWGDRRPSCSPSQDRWRTRCLLRRRANLLRSELDAGAGCRRDHCPSIVRRGGDDLWGGGVPADTGPGLRPPRRILLLGKAIASVHVSRCDYSPGR
jgi:hypothetical protein